VCADRIEVSPTAMAAGGDAIARDATGRVVFVTGALPGERIVAEVVAARRDYARARLVEVLDPSPERVEAPCEELARGCGGCQWQHVSLDGQRGLKRDIVADALRRIARLDGPEPAATVALPDAGYRTTVRAAVVEGRAGYRRGGGHDVVTVDGCLVAHPLIADLLVHGRFGRATEVVLRVGSRTGERMAAPDPDDADITVPEGTRRDHVHEMVAGRRWRISAASFFQSSPEGADALAALVATAADGAGAPSVAVDLYAGVGLFAGVLADRGWTVTAVEGSRAAVGDARWNLADDRARVVRSEVAAWRPRSAAFVVADPSRSGLGRPGTAVVVATGAPRVVLVSCDPAAFARDAGLLVGAGYHLSSVTPVDLFPHTTHVEVVSVYDREA
jgi:23S rRNA (uracil1939-C5)-methyltransferase